MGGVRVGSGVLMVMVSMAVVVVCVGARESVCGGFSRASIEPCFHRSIQGSWSAAPWRLGGGAGCR